MADYSRYQEISARLEDRVLTITMDSPEASNALRGNKHEELEAIWYDIAADDSVGAVILTGSGDRVFSAGGDIRRMVERAKKPEIRSFIGAKRIIGSMLEVEQPIIAAVNGHAVGLGCSLAFACDIIVASDRARFADTHVNMGLVAGDGGIINFPLMMGIHKAKEYLMTGMWLPATEAAQMGYINYAVPHEEVMPKAREIATRLAHGPTWAIRWTKTSINKILRDRWNLIMDSALAVEWLTFMTEDHREAANAFIEKRQPVFRGR